MFKLIFALLVAMTFSCHENRLTICGHVQTDTDTISVKYASVLILDGDSLIDGMDADSNGYFKIMVVGKPSTVNIRVSQIGYEPIEKRIDVSSARNCVNVFLKSSPDSVIQH
jgi:hypothetical protein